MDLENALEQFDAVEANVRKLKEVVREMSKLIPRGTGVIDGEPEGQRYSELLRSWHAIVRALPPIGDYQIQGSPLSLDSRFRSTRRLPGAGFTASALRKRGSAR